MQVINNITGFDWARNNLNEDFTINHIHWLECEEVFFNEPMIVGAEYSQLKFGKRYYALGATDSGLKLFVVFKIMNRNIKIISARKMSKEERKIYERG